MNNLIHFFLDSAPRLQAQFENGATIVLAALNGKLVFSIDDSLKVQTGGKQIRSHLLKHMTLEESEEFIRCVLGSSKFKEGISVGLVQGFRGHLSDLYGKNVPFHIGKE